MKHSKYILELMWKQILCIICKVKGPVHQIFPKRWKGENIIHHDRLRQETLLY